MAIALGKDAAFKGRTFEEMVAPLKEYATAYNAVEQQYDNLAMQANAISQMMEAEPEGSKAKATYNAYLQGLNGAVDDFSRGMTMANRSALTGLKRGYARDVVPINNAVEAKKAIVKTADNIQASNKGDVIFEVDPNSISIDTLIANPSMGVGRYFSRKAVADYVASAAGNLKNEERERLLRALGTDTSYYAGYPTSRSIVYDVGYRHGYTSEEVMNAINSYLEKDKSTSDSNDILEMIIRGGMDYAGISDWRNATEAQRNAAKRAVAEGITAAIGSTTHGSYHVDDPNFTPTPPQASSSSGSGAGRPVPSTAHTINPSVYIKPDENLDEKKRSLVNSVAEGLLQGKSADDVAKDSGFGSSADLDEILPEGYKTYDIIRNGTLEKEIIWSVNLDSAAKNDVINALVTIANEGLVGIDKSRTSFEGKGKWGDLIDSFRKSDSGVFPAGFAFSSKGDVYLRVMFENKKQDLIKIPESMNGTLMSQIRREIKGVFDKGKYVDGYKYILDEVYRSIASLYTTEKNKGVNNEPTSYGASQAYGGRLRDRVGFKPWA